MQNFPNFVFEAAGAPLLLFWILIVLLPKWTWTERIYRTKLPMIYLAVMYSAIIVYGLATDPASFATLLNPDLAGVQTLLGTAVGATAGWIHFLCFDLLVGTIIWRRALDKGHSFFWVSPVMLLTLMLAPMGWLLFEVLSFFLSREPAEAVA
ncbi:MAG: ABA4-like family protein [Pseudomonadota bacterium]